MKLLHLPAWVTECLYYDIWQTADEITVDVYVNVIVCTVKSTVTLVNLFPLCRSVIKAHALPMPCRWKKGQQQLPNHSQTS